MKFHLELGIFSEFSELSTRVRGVLRGPIFWETVTKAVTFSSFPSYHLPGDSSSSDESSDEKDIKATRPVKTTTSTERGERKRAGSKVIAVI